MVNFFTQPLMRLKSIKGVKMETVIVRPTISIDRWKAMKEYEINDIVSMYSGQLIDAKCDGNNVILEIVAPSTWRYLWLNALLLPYRYC